jgi:hypothetical protein
MTRRMTLLVLALLGLMVLVVTIAPPEGGRRGTPQSQNPTPTPSPLLSDPDAFDVDETLTADPGEKRQTVEAELGDRVRITVEGTQPDSVMLGDMETLSLEAGVPARFQVLADTPGTYPLTLESTDKPIGTLEVR